MRLRSLLARFLVWRSKNISQRNFVLLLAILVGLASGLVAVVLKNSVHFIQQVLTTGFAAEYNNYLYFAYPLIGIFITVLIIRYLLKREVNPGIPATLFSISRRNSIIPRNNMFSYIITSIVTVGFGGSSGLEAPAVGSSAAIASNLGRWSRQSYQVKTLLIGCAAAASIAAIFNAPIAAIVFAIEVIMLDLTTASLIPLLLASVAAALTSRFFLGNDVLVHVNIDSLFQLKELPFYILLGMLAGFFSIYFTRITVTVHSLADRIGNRYTKTLVCGIVLGGLIFLFPALYGEGYDVVNAMATGDFARAFENSFFYNLSDNILLVCLLLFAIVILKVVATNLTLAGGGVGGIFAPSLFMGSVMGFSFATLLNYLNLGKFSGPNFSLVGMAAFMSGIMHAPLTAIFLIAEITGGYELFIPLMIATSISYLTVRYFQPHSIYTYQLAKRGELITHHKDQAVLTLMNLENEIEKDFTPVKASMLLGELVKTVSQSKRNLFPVLNARGELEGIVSLNDIREIMFNREMYETTKVADIMGTPPAVIQSTDSMKEVVQTFESTNAWNLPVTKEGRYIGFVSKSKLFSAYRNKLRGFYGE